MEVYVETVNLHGLAKSEDDFKFRFNGKPIFLTSDLNQS